jgi:enoyl-CoA hydratase
MTVLDTHLENGVAVLTLNDPERRNAFTLDLVSAIVGAMDYYEREGKCGAVVVTGAGPAFCAGADLGHLAGATSNDLMEIYEGFLRIAQSPLPTIAAVNGPAVGAGMNLALACDVRITAESGRFDTRFLKLGIHPGGGHTWMLSRLVGPQTAAAMVLFSEIVNGPDAVARGLAWQCVPDEQLMPTALALAAKAAAVPLELVRRTKATLEEVGRLATHEEAVDNELVDQLWSIGEPAFMERLSAMRAQISQQP